MSFKRHIKFEYRVFARRKARQPAGLWAIVALPRPGKRKLKSSFIAVTRKLLTAEMPGPSALASRWQLVLQQPYVSKR
jgi:hypothetical protein